MHNTKKNGEIKEGETHMSAPMFSTAGPVKEAKTG
jgi:hypothetical protein